MPDYSKLSDQVIAERVAGAMGMEMSANRDFFIDDFYDFADSISLPKPVEQAIPHPYADRALPFLFFDWPAPLMMAKCEEMLVDGHLKADKQVVVRQSVEAYGEGLVERKAYIDELSLDVDAVLVKSLSKTRALYEAFLQVMEAKK